MSGEGYFKGGVGWPAMIVVSASSPGLTNTSTHIWWQLHADTIHWWHVYLHLSSPKVCKHTVPVHGCYWIWRSCCVFCILHGLGYRINLEKPFNFKIKCSERKSHIAYRPKARQINTHKNRPTFLMHFLLENGNCGRPPTNDQTINSSDPQLVILQGTESKHLPANVQKITWILLHGDLPSNSCKHYVTMYVYIKYKKIYT